MLSWSSHVPSGTLAGWLIGEHDRNSALGRALIAQRSATAVVAIDAYMPSVRGLSHCESDDIPIDAPEAPLDLGCRLWTAISIYRNSTQARILPFTTACSAPRELGRALLVGVPLFRRRFMIRQLSTGMKTCFSCLTTRRLGNSVPLDRKCSNDTY